MSVRGASRAYDRVLERRRAVALARHFREDEGLSIAQIAERLTSILGKGRRGGVRGERGAVLPLFWGFGGHRRA